MQKNGDDSQKATLRRVKRELNASDDYIVLTSGKQHYKVLYKSEESFGLLLNLCINSYPFRQIMKAVVQQADEYFEDQSDQGES